MNIRHRLSGPGLALLLAALTVTAPSALSAQGDADFLFKTPVLTLGVHGGWSMPGESSDVFEFVRDELTVDRGAFSSATWGAEVAGRLTERLDVAVALEYAKASTRSEFRDWVDTDDNPIEQTTSLRRIPLTVSARGYLYERGRAISEYAWVPNAWSPYLGVGAGYTWYHFEQDGDFVDFNTREIFTDNLQSEGAAATVHVLAGVEASLSEHFLLRGEYRYSWGSAEPDGHDWGDFDRIDLGGGRATLGFAVRL